MLPQWSVEQSFRESHNSEILAAGSRREETGCDAIFLRLWQCCALGPRGRGAEAQSSAEDRIESLVVEVLGLEDGNL